MTAVEANQAGAVFSVLLTMGPHEWRLMHQDNVLYVSVPAQGGEPEREFMMTIKEITSGDVSSPYFDRELPSPRMAADDFVRDSARFAGGAVSDSVPDSFGDLEQGRGKGGTDTELWFGSATVSSSSDDTGGDGSVVVIDAQGDGGQW